MTASAREALEAVRPLLEARPLLLVSDFDGTLSQINLDPWAARMLPLAQRALRRLAGIGGVHVAILSGRTAADVAARSRIGGATYLGNHGVERGALVRRQRATGMAVEIAAVDPLLTAAAERLAIEVPVLVPEPWLVVERKGSSVAFHYRGAPDVDAAGARVRAAVERLDPGHLLQRFPGRRVMELRPLGSPAKGDAMRRLLEEIAPRAAMVLGDDLSDAEAFVALREAREAGAVQGLALAVQARSEVPVGVTDAADLVLASPTEAARFLSGVARAVVGQVPPPSANRDGSIRRVVSRS
ncbi:MAG: trehalose-phosphatase [Candidatus Limnocylindrales bacterium]